jgi:hypothetical protein
MKSATGLKPVADFKKSTSSTPHNTQKSKVSSLSLYKN